MQEQTEVVEPPRVTVVTPDNFEEYVEEKVGKPAGVEADAEPEAESEVKPEPKPDDRKKGKLNERFSELTQARKDAEAKAAAAEAKAAEVEAKAKEAREARDAAERQAAELRAKYEPPPPDEIGPEPTHDQFADVGEYAKALKDWTAENTRREDAKAAATAKMEAERKRVSEEFIKRQNEFKSQHEDYESTIAGSDVKVSDDIRDAIVESDVGPALLLHLAKNPDYAEKLAGMTVGRALRELGKLEATLTGTATPKEPVKASVAEISRAPAPITPLRGASSPITNKVDSDGNFYGTYEEYKKLRQAGKIK